MTVIEPSEFPQETTRPAHRRGGFRFIGDCFTQHRRTQARAWSWTQEAADLFEGSNLMADILEFRRPDREKPAQANPLMVPVAQYFIGVAIVGLLVISIIDVYMGDQRGRRH